MLIVSFLGVSGNRKTQGNVEPPVEVVLAIVSLEVHNASQSKVKVRVFGSKESSVYTTRLVSARLQICEALNP